MEKMTRNSNALKRDGSVMPDSDEVDFLSGSTDSAINFRRSVDLHTHIHPPPSGEITQNRAVKSRMSVNNSSSSRVTQDVQVTDHEE